jgi:hypothetical protein
VVVAVRGGRGVASPDRWMLVRAQDRYVPVAFLVCRSANELIRSSRVRVI